MRSVDLQLPRLVGALSIGVSALLALALPLTYLGAGYNALASSLQIKANVKAEIVTQLIGSQPEMWRFAEHRLQELLVRFPAQLDDEQGWVLDEAGNVIAATEASPPGPLLVRATPLFDSGTLVGRVELHTSMRGLLLETAALAAISMLLAAATFVLLRILPTRAQRLVDAMFDEKERARVTLHSIGDGVITTDRNETIEYLNPVAESLTGWTAAEAVRRPLSEVMQLVDEATLEPTHTPMAQALRDNAVRSFASQVALVRRDGSSVAIEDSAAPIHDRQGQVIGGVMVFHDVTAARSMAQRVTWAATHDALTGLVNRREFENRVEEALGNARNSSRNHALCYMDLDQFKIVNDTCGHAAGDALLKRLSAILLSKLRQSDTLARLGGDEFGILLEGCPLERARLIAADVLATVQEFRFAWQDKSFKLGASIGLVAITKDSPNRAEIFSAADTACFAAKEQGRNRISVFHSADVDIAQRRREMGWAARLTDALEQERFALYYQPYLCLNQEIGAARHVEMLLRLIDEEGTVVLPGSFLPAAERYNLMPAIDRWVIRTAFTRYHDLAAQLGAPLVCAINLSGTSLNSEGLLDYIREQAQQNALPRGAICFEITETAAINHLRQAAQFMMSMKELGFLFALDDFGTGTSSFGYLKSLPVDFLKIDGSFVRDMARDPLDRAMAETINRVGRIMGLKTVGEFAESEAAVDGLRAIGVDFAQGYAVQPPQPLPGPARSAPPSPRAVRAPAHRPAPELTDAIARTSEPAPRQA